MRDSEPLADEDAQALGQHIATNAERVGLAEMFCPGAAVACSFKLGKTEYRVTIEVKQ